MIETSQEFINALKGVQTVSARISILNSPEITNYGYEYSDIEPMILNNNYVKNNKYNKKDINQLNDCVTYETGNYAIFEGEGITLDGTIQVPSKDAKNNQYGWYSNYRYIGDNQHDYYEYEENNYSDIQEHTYAEIAGDIETQSSSISWKFFTDKVEDLNIVFSKIRNEYATRFDIILTTSNESKTISITKNNKTVYVIDKNEIPVINEDGLEVKLIIYNWSKANARAKVICMYMGCMLQYTDEDIVSFNTTKELDLVNDNLPSKQIDLVIQDTKEEYNIFEPKGNLANLNANSRICLEEGVLIDDFIYYVKTDEFIATKPKKESNSLEVSIIGIGRLSAYNDIDFNYNYYDENRVEDLLKNEKYIIIDENIKNRNTSFRTQFGTISMTEALRKLGLACRANVVEDIDNNILIKDLLEKSIVTNSIVMENMMENPSIEKIDRPRKVEIKVYYNELKDTVEILNQNIEVLKEPTNYLLGYNVDHTKPNYNTIIKYEDGTEKDITDSLEYLENRAKWNNVLEDKEQIVNISITGQEIELSSSSINYNYNENGTESKTIDNECIQKTSIAKNLLEWLKERYNKEFELEVEVQDTFTYELGDMVTIETNVYVNNKMITIDAVITKIEQKYEGSLHYTIRLRGAYNV